MNADELKRENKLLKREIERLKARLDLARDKEISLLDDIIELKRELRDRQRGQTDD